MNLAGDTSVNRGGGKWNNLYGDADMYDVPRDDDDSTSHYNRTNDEDSSAQYNALVDNPEEKDDAEKKWCCGTLTGKGCILTWTASVTVTLVIAFLLLKFLIGPNLIDSYIAKSELKFTSVLLTHPISAAARPETGSLAARPLQLLRRYGDLGSMVSVQENTVPESVVLSAVVAFSATGPCDGTIAPTQMHFYFEGQEFGYLESTPIDFKADTQTVLDLSSTMIISDASAFTKYATALLMDTELSFQVCINTYLYTLVYLHESVCIYAGM